MVWPFWDGWAHPFWDGWAYFGMGGRFLAWVGIFLHQWAPPDTYAGMGGRRILRGGYWLVPLRVV
jgi:hypothetical protein